MRVVQGVKAPLLRASGQFVAYNTVLHRPCLRNHTRVRAAMAAEVLTKSEVRPGAEAAPVAPVVVFTTPGCPYCKRAKGALKDGGYAFTEVDVSVDKQLRTTLNETTGQRTVPQIYAYGTYVGGCDDLLAKLQDSSFSSLAKSEPAGDAIGCLPDALRSAAEKAAADAQRPTPGPAGRAPTVSPELLAVAASLADPAGGVLAGCNSSDKTFSGKKLLDWLQKNSIQQQQQQQQPGTEALGSRLLASNLVTLAAAVQPSAEDTVALRAGARYRLLSDAPRSVAWGQALNTHYWWGLSPARPAEVVAEDLRSQILGLYDKHLSKDGRFVDYGAMREDPAFWAYVNATAELQRVTLGPLSREALIAFTTNTYNALIIHTLVVHGTAQYKSSTGRVSFFNKAARYNIGGYEYTADDLENGILRGNRPAASTIGMLLGCPKLSSGPFGKGDPRASKLVDPIDPRIHFALVCGAKSCPPIKLYSSENLEEGLQGATEAFCASDVQVDAPSRSVTLSKIFKWYSPDFGKTKAERLRFLLPYLADGPRSALEGLLASDPSAGGITVRHREYDWSLNGQE